MSCFDVSSRQTTGRAGWVRPVVDFQHILHAGDESGVGVRRDHPLLMQVGSERILWDGPPRVDAAYRVARQEERRADMEIAVLGIGLGKNSCSVVGLDGSGRVVLR